MCFWFQVWISLLHSDVPVLKVSCFLSGASVGMSCEPRRLV